MNVAIIPARGGSRRIPGKNIRLFHGKPIIAYPIAAAREAGCFDDIIVSTEHERTRAVAKAYGAKIHLRPTALADDDVGTQAVMRSALAWWVSCHQGREPELACCIYATTPLMGAADLLLGYAAMADRWVEYAYVEGWYYWGRAEAFMRGAELDGPNSVKQVIVREHRHIDINTEEDWRRAERMYQELQQQALEQREPAQ